MGTIETHSTNGQVCWLFLPLGRPALEYNMRLNRGHGTSCTYRRSNTWFFDVGRPMSWVGWAVLVAPCIRWLVSWLDHGGGFKLTTLFCFHFSESPLLIKFQFLKISNVDAFSRNLRVSRCTFHSISFDMHKQPLSSLQEWYIALAFPLT